MQLTAEQIEEIYQEALSKRGQLPDRINYKWVKENGVYDIVHTFIDSSLHLREFVYNGKIIYIANKSWVDDPVANQQLPKCMREPWGTYPDLPPKPKS